MKKTILRHFNGVELELRFFGNGICYYSLHRSRSYLHNRIYMSKNASTGVRLSLHFNDYWKKITKKQAKLNLKIFWILNGTI